jgi:hypothetical protein
LENAWLKHPTFLASVLPGWSGVFVLQDAAGALVGRIKALRRDAKAWSRQHHRARPADLNNASFVVLLLDMYEEYRVLTSAERRLRNACREHVTLLVAQRVAYWKQQGKLQALREGDANTKFFHARASFRGRWNTIRTLDVDGVQLLAHDAKMAALTAHYTNILGGEAPVTWSFDVAELYRGAQRVDPVSLVAPFNAQEALAAVQAMAADSAPGPDGVGLGFYAAAWDSVKDDVMSFLNAFHRGVVELERINCVLIVLLSKTEAAAMPAQFCPVSLQKCPVKILTKLLTTRLQRQIPGLIDADQTGFIKGRSISENFVLATELVQCCHKRRAPTLVIKLDFVKVFDSVQWASLLSILQTRGFPDKWLAWMRELLTTSKSAVLLNRVSGPWISCKRGL